MESLTGKDITEVHNREYADAWAVTGQLMASVRDVRTNLDNLLRIYPRMYFPWVMILNKLLRILGSPSNPDHWLDIQGYANLVWIELTPSEKGLKDEQK